MAAKENAGTALANGESKAWIGIIDNIANPFWRVIVQIIVAVVIMFWLYILSKWIANLVARSIMSGSTVADPDYTKKVSLLISNVVFYTLMVFSIGIALTVVGIDVSIILGWLTFGLWFAFKEIFSNMIAGLLVLTTKEYKIGDLIEFQDANNNNYFGRIEEITIRYSVIRTLDLRRVVIPNLDLITRPVKTYDSEDMVRLDFVVGLWYGVNLDTAFALCKEAINELEWTTEKEHTRVTVFQIWASTVDCKVWFYFDPTKLPRPVALSEATKAVFEKLIHNNIDVAYPHMAITVDHNDKNLLGSALYLMREWKK
jgi:small conductance mechanosensitive channel